MVGEKAVALMGRHGEDAKIVFREDIPLSRAQPVLVRKHLGPGRRLRQLAIIPAHDVIEFVIIIENTRPSRLTPNSWACNRQRTSRGREILDCVAVIHDCGGLGFLRQVRIHEVNVEGVICRSA